METTQPDSRFVQLTRWELYDQVWSTPVMNLSKRYGLSDVGLAKVCKKYQIPRPPTGYWAKVKHGQSPPRAELPTFGEAEPTIELWLAPPDYAVGDEPTRQLLQKSKADRITVPEDLADLHPLVRKTRTFLRKVEPNEDGRIGPAGIGCLDLIVSRRSSNRALRILNSLLVAFEKRGWKVLSSTEDSKRSTQVEIFGETIGFRLEERTRTHLQESTRSGQQTNSQYPWLNRFERRDPIQITEPTGELTVEIVGHADLRYCRRHWRDTESRKLEVSINAVTAGLIRIASIVRDQTIEAAAHGVR